MFLSIYEKNRNEILKILEAEDFLEQTLHKLLTISKNLDIPTIPKQQTLDIHKKTKKKFLLPRLSHQENKPGEIFSGKLSFEDFMNGVSSRERNPQKPPLSLETEICREWERHSFRKRFGEL